MSNVRRAVHLFLQIAINATNSRTFFARALTTLLPTLRLRWDGPGSDLNNHLRMRDIVFYLGTDAEDFSVISATFSQFARLVELHFITAPGDLVARLDAPGTLPSLMFMSLLPDRARVLELLRQIKSHADVRWIPVVLIGGKDDQWSHDEAISTGAAALLRSPLQSHTLQRLFSAAGDLLIRPQEDVPLLVASAQQ
jgi:CheY-like chemotaxis protein